MPNPEDIRDPTTAMNMALALMAKAFKLNYFTPTKNNQRISSNSRNRQIAQPSTNMGQDRHMQMVGGNGGNQFRHYARKNVGNLNGYNNVQNVGNQVIQHAVQNPRIQNVGNQNGLIGVPGNANQNLNGNGVGHFARNRTVILRRRDVAYLQTQLLIAQKEEAGIQLQAEEFDLMAAVANLDEIEEVNAKCILMANLQQASILGTQTDKAPVYDSDGSAENDNNVISEDSGVEQSWGTVEQHPINVKETRALYDSLYNNLEIEVEKVNTVNHKLSETNAELTTELARYKKSKKATKFVRDFKSLAKEADESLAKHKTLELEIEHLLRAVVSQDIISVVQNNYVDETSNLQTEPERTKEQFENSYNDMQQKIERLQAQLGDLKGKSKDTSCVSYTLNPLSWKLENENVELEFQVSDQKDTACSKSVNTKFTKQSILGKPPKVGMFRINPFKPSMEEKHVPNKVRASIRTKLITVSQPPIITKKVVNSDSNGLSPTGVDNTKTRRPQPRSNTKNDRVPSASKSSQSKNKEVEVEEHHRILLLSRNKKHMSSECNNVKLATQNVKSKVVCAMCKQCLNSVNHDMCLLNYVNGVSSRGKKQTANVSINENQKKQQPKVKKPKKVGSIERLASPKPSKPRSFLRWSPTGRLFDLKGKIIASTQRVNLTALRVIMVYFFEGLDHNLFSIGQFCDSDLEVAFRRNACFIINLEGVDLLLGNRTTNLYTINLHEMASASPICLMTRVSSTKSWLWHQRLSHLNFDTINDLAKKDLVFGLPKFKYHKEHLCPSCEQGKSKRASHPPKPVPNSRQRLHLLHMDLYGPMRIVSINGKRDCYCAQNRSILHRRFNKTPYELINGRKSDISFLHVFGDLCYPKNDREDIGKLGAKGDIGFFIGYSADSCAYRVFNRRTKKIMETINVSFDELSTMAFEQRMSTIEPKNAKEAMTDPAWIESMQEELLQFERLDVWVLVPTPDNITPLTLKWLFKNKHDEEKMVIRNKSHLVMGGYRQEEGIDFEESFAPVAKWKLS
uniref:Retrovirus-related Pol polyprotein from transposon TNT 1-94 n=1 Tax=Tanacetum cinerariifolium TaxID=118510 RepID=A0A6L2KSE9_TANCI|nr:retrovirus-related Pol polyprotein from transposon TNT 1-94 [Tanacetum cinerariifolium]